jgi:hypothetical protein
MFELVRTGRVYCIGFGSKTYIDKNHNGNYCWQSLSNGKIFAQECYSTLKECIREFFVTVVSRQISGMYGVKKEEMRNWVSSNIPVGMGLTMSDIIEKYKELEGKKKVDFLELSKDSRALNIIVNAFGGIFEKQPYDYDRYDEYTLTFNIFKPFGLDICEYGDRARPISVVIRAGMKGKNSIKSDWHGEIVSLGDHDTALKYFDTALPKLLINKLSGNNNNGYGYYIQGVDNLCPELLELVKYIFRGDYDANNNLSDILDSYLSKIKTKNPIIFSSAIQSLESSGKFPELVDKYIKSDKATIKAGSILKRFEL